MLALTKHLFGMILAATLAMAGSLPTEAVHPKLRSLSKRELDARAQVLASLPDRVRQDLERRDPSEYTVYYDHLLEKRQSAHGPGIDKCADDKTGPSISYDDGPYEWTDELADAYADSGHTITYFVNVNNWACSYASPYAERLQHALSRGHTIGSHTGTHADLQTLNWDQIDEQIQLVETYLWDVLGVVPAYVRPPYGSTNDSINAHLQDRWGLHVVEWSVDAGDATGSTPDQSIAAVTAATNYDLVLNHETHETSVHQVAHAVIDNFNSRGIKSRGISECTQAGQPYKVKLDNPNRQRDSTWDCNVRKVPAPGKSSS